MPDYSDISTPPFVAPDDDPDAPKRSKFATIGDFAKNTLSGGDPLMSIGRGMKGITFGKRSTGSSRSSGLQDPAASTPAVASGGAGTEQTTGSQMADDSGLQDYQTALDNYSKTLHTPAKRPGIGRLIAGELAGGLFPSVGQRIAYGQQGGEMDQQAALARSKEEVNLAYQKAQLGSLMQSRKDASADRQAKTYESGANQFPVEFQQESTDVPAPQTQPMSVPESSAMPSVPTGNQPGALTSEAPPDLSGQTATATPPPAGPSQTITSTPQMQAKQFSQQGGGVAQLYNPLTKQTETRGKLSPKMIELQKKNADAEVAQKDYLTIPDEVAQRMKLTLGTKLPFAQWTSMIDADAKLHNSPAKEKTPDAQLLASVVQQQATKLGLTGINSLSDLPIDAQIAAGKAWEQLKKTPDPSLAALRQQGQDSRQDGLTQRSYQFHTGQMDKMANPIEQQIQRMSRVQDSLFQRTPEADALIAPELLTAMAGGQGSGLRMNEAEISRIVGGRTNWESLKAAVNKWQLDPRKGLSVTDDQRKQMQELIQVMNKRLTAKEAVIDGARQQLVGSNDPNEHRQIYANMRRDLARIDMASGDPAATPGASGSEADAVKALVNQYGGKK